MKDLNAKVSESEQTDAGEDISKGKDGGTRKVIVKHGDSPDTPHEGAICTVNIVGRRRNGLVLLDEREVTFKMGEGSEHGIVRVVERALRRFKRGERARIQVLGTTRYQRGPALSDLSKEQADTSTQATPAVDEKEMMVIYDIELKDFHQVKEHWELSVSERLVAAEAFKMRGTEFFKAGMYRLAKKNYKKVLQHIGTSTSFGKPTVNIPADDTPAQHDKDPGSLNFASRVSHNRPTDQGDSELHSQLQLAAHLNLALCYLKLGNNLKALDSSDRALEIEPTSDKGLYRRGQAHLAMDNLDAAVQDFTAVLSLDPRNSIVQQQLAVARQRLTQYTEKQRSVYAGMFTKFAAFDCSREEEKNRGKEDVFSEIGEWSNELAKDMMTLEQEMAAFGEVMPQPKYSAGGVDSKEGENEPLDSDSD